MPYPYNNSNELQFCEEINLPKSRPDLANEINGEAHILSFIVRIWREEAVAEKHQSNWRGHITPVPNGKRHYFSDIKDIANFIAAHLKAQR